MRTPKIILLICHYRWLSTPLTRLLYRARSLSRNGFPFAQQFFPLGEVLGGPSPLSEVQGSSSRRPYLMMRKFMSRRHLVPWDPDALLSYSEVPPYIGQEIWSSKRSPRKHDTKYTPSILKYRRYVLEHRENIMYIWCTKDVYINWCIHMIV